MENSKNPKVSIIVPVYNIEKYIGACIDSILRQSYRNFELILVDDGSTDNSGNLCNKYAQKDNRITLIRQKNAGVSAARNAGLKIATGQLIAFVDSDDYISTYFLEKMVLKMNSDSLDVVECAYCEFDDSGNTYSFVRPYSYIAGVGKIINRNVLGDISVLVWNKLYRRELITCYFQEGEPFEDILFTANVLVNCHKIASINEPLYFWRKRIGSISRSDFAYTRFLALDHFEQRAKLFLEYACNKSSIKAQMLRESTIELKMVNFTDDYRCLAIENSRAKKIYQKYQLTLGDFFKLPSNRERIRYVYYLFQFFDQYRKNLKKLKWYAGKGD